MIFPASACQAAEAFRSADQHFAFPEGGPL